jgi:Protein of unknown function (DUF3551)
LLPRHYSLLFLSRRLRARASIAKECQATEFCDFDTLAQCQAMASGAGGDCIRDPFLTNTPNNALAYLPKHQRSKTVRKPVQNQ